MPDSMPDYLRAVLTSRVYEVAIESPLTVASRLSRRIGHHVLLKREDLQPVFSFSPTPVSMRCRVLCIS